MKKFLLIPLMIVLVSGLIFGGCAVSPSTPAPMPTPAPVPAPMLPGQEEVYNIDLMEKLRANDDGLQSIQVEHKLGRSLNDFFNGRITTSDGAQVRIDVDDYWTSSGLTIPENYRYLAIYSRRVFNYPIGIAYTKLATLAAGRYIWPLGFETGGGGRLSYVSFKSSDTKFAAQAWGVSLEITSFLPDDYDTAEHTYGIKVNKSNTEFYIDDELKAIILHGIKEALPKWENNAPYALGSSIRQWQGAKPILAEVEGGGELTYPLDITGNRFIASDGDPLPPRQYVLYSENTPTKWDGLSTGSEITSHPVPVWGYDRKTLFFQSNAAGTLKVQVYAGRGWRNMISITLEANVLRVYNLNAEVPIVRCVYTPVGTDKIAVAEWYLGEQ